MHNTKKIVIIIYLQIIKFILGRNNTICLKINSGLLKNMKWNMSKYSSNEFILGIYEKEITEIFRHYINKDDVIYDIGAHHGYFSLIYSYLTGINGVVYAFEAIKNNVEILNKNINKNKIKNIKVFNVAISNKKTELEFTNTKNSVANTYIKTSPLFKMSLSSVFVKATSVDKLIENKIIRVPNFIKIDVEGAELDVLEGAKKMLIVNSPILLVATHEPHYKGVEKKVVCFMQKLNYFPKEIFIHNNNIEMKDFLFVKKNEK